MTLKTFCGYVAIVGRPNVGKSTLINRLIGQKLSIISHKPQTTRHKILGIQTNGNTQALYIDTPGIQTTQKRILNQRMNKAAYNSIQTADVICFVVEAPHFRKTDQQILDKLQTIKAPIILAINKIDKLPQKSQLLPFIHTVSNRYPFKALVPISARRGIKVTRLARVLHRYLPPREFCFTEKKQTDCSERFRMAEFIREPLIQYLHQELPYSIAVEIESVKRHKTSAVQHISAIIWVENPNQKRIVIGKKGEKLKVIGTKARLKIENLLKKRVYLTLWVKIKPNWPDQVKWLNQQQL